MAALTLEVVCTECEKHLEVPDSASGAFFTCPHCGTEVSVPADDGEPGPAGDDFLPMGGEDEDTDDRWIVDDPPQTQEAAAPRPSGPSDPDLLQKPRQDVQIAGVRPVPYARIMSVFSLLVNFSVVGGVAMLSGDPVSFFTENWVRGQVVFLGAWIGLFLMALAAAWAFNIACEYMGPVEMTLDTQYRKTPGVYELRSVSPFHAGLLALGVSLLIWLMYLAITAGLIGAFGEAAKLQVAQLGINAAAIAMSGVFIGIGGAILGTIYAVFYNVLAGLMGGIEVGLG